MNKNRRKRIEDLIHTLEEVSHELQLLAEEEEEAYDNMPESFQDGERGDTMQGIISDLEYADGNLTDVIDSLQEVINR